MVSQRFELGSDLVTTATEKQAELTGLHLQTGKLLAGNAATISSRVSAAVPFVQLWCSMHNVSACIMSQLNVSQNMSSLEKLVRLYSILCACAVQGAIIVVVAV